MKKLKSIVAIYLIFSLLVSCLFSVAATPSVEDSLPSNKKITSSLMEQYALVDDDKVLTQVWFSDIDLSSAEVTALKSAGITKAELSDYETVDPFAISNLNLAEQNDKIQT